MSELEHPMVILAEAHNSIRELIGQYLLDSLNNGKISGDLSWKELSNAGSYIILDNESKQVQVWIEDLKSSPLLISVSFHDRGRKIHTSPTQVSANNSFERIVSDIRSTFKMWHESFKIDID